MYGIGGYEVKIYKGILEQFLSVAKLLNSNMKIDEIVELLKRMITNDEDGYEKIILYLRSHKSQSKRNTMMLKLIKNLPLILLREEGLKSLEPQLSEIASLTDPL